MPIFDTAEPILVNFVKVSLKCQHISYDTIEWHTLHNTASSGPVWLILVNGDHIIRMIRTI